MIFALEKPKPEPVAIPSAEVACHTGRFLLNGILIAWMNDDGILDINQFVDDNDNYIALKELGVQFDKNGFIKVRK